MSAIAPADVTAAELAALPPQSAFQSVENPCVAHTLDAAMSRIRQFHLAFGNPAPLQLSFGDPAVKMLRARLILEEFKELLWGLGCPDPAQLIDALLDEDERIPADTEPDTHFRDQVDPIEVADALADLTCVVLGTAVAHGVPLSPCFDEIMRSNMTKLGADGKPKHRPDGKVLKGPNYQRPNLTPILFPGGAQEGEPLPA